MQVNVHHTSHPSSLPSRASPLFMVLCVGACFKKSKALVRLARTVISVLRAQTWPVVAVRTLLPDKLVLPAVHQGETRPFPLLPASSKRPQPWHIRPFAWKAIHIRRDTPPQCDRLEQARIGENTVFRCLTSITNRSHCPSSPRLPRSMMSRSDRRQIGSEHARLIATPGKQSHGRGGHIGGRRRTSCSPRG